MANSWLRLWHDMPNDPKWRVIAKASGQPVHLVIALYVALLVDASKNKSRGVTKCHDEDLAVTLDCDMSQIAAIKEAMQGRVLAENHLTGWETRQPKREDSGDEETGAKSAAERKRAERERKKLQEESEADSTCHEMSRNVTADKDKEEDKELKPTPSREPSGFAEFWAAYPKKVGKGAAEKTFKAARINGHLPDLLSAIETQKRSDQWQKDGGQYIPAPARWLKERRWEDGLLIGSSASAGWTPPKNGDTRKHPIHGANEKFVQGAGWVLT